MDTTSHFLKAMIYYVYKNPEVLDLLKTEIKSQAQHENFSFEDIKKMNYL